MGQQLHMTVAEVDALRDKLLALPEAEPEKLGKRQIVLRLLPAIEAMRAKRYTLAAIVNQFAANGIVITVAALKSILSHAQEGGAAPKGRKHRKRKEQLRVQKQAAAERASGAQNSEARGEPSNKTDLPPAGRPKTPTSGENKGEVTAVASALPTAMPAVTPSGRFVPRPDSGEL